MFRFSFLFTVAIVPSAKAERSWQAFLSISSVPRGSFFALREFHARFLYGFSTVFVCEKTTFAEFINNLLLGLERKKESEPRVFAPDPDLLPTYSFVTRRATLCYSNDQIIRVLTPPFRRANFRACSIPANEIASKFDVRKFAVIAFTDSMISSSIDFRTPPLSVQKSRHFLVF